jgi:hypothetical protein
MVCRLLQYNKFGGVGLAAILAITSKFQHGFELDMEV